jgi:hypothetical protein
MVERREEGRLILPHDGHDDVERRDAGSWAPTSIRPSTINRISWGAVFAGAAVALVAQLLLSLLGLAIGLTIIEPLTGETPWEGIGIGAGIWWIISALLSLFLGGWTAGRLSGMPLRQDAILHGIVAWALVTFISFYLVITGVGAVIGGAFSVVQQGMQLVGSGIGTVAPQAADALSDQQGLTLEQIQAEAAEIIGAADSGGAEVPSVPADVSAQDLSTALQRLLVEGSEADRQTVISILVQQGGMSEAEASNTVAQYEQRYQQVADTLGQRAADVTQDATNAVAMSAWWAFFALLIGGIAASVGAAMSAPRDLPASPEVRRE